MSNSLCVCVGTMCFAYICASMNRCECGFCVSVLGMSVYLYLCAFVSLCPVGSAWLVGRPSVCLSVRLSGRLIVRQRLSFATSGSSVPARWEEIAARLGAGLAGCRGRRAGRVVGGVCCVSVCLCRMEAVRLAGGAGSAGCVVCRPGIAAGSEAAAPHRYRSAGPVTSGSPLNQSPQHQHQSPQHQHQSP